jgi:hypothetical protein
MTYTKEITSKIKYSLENIESIIDSLILQNRNLIEANQELIKENNEIKKECQKALIEVENTIKTIDVITDQNGNNNNKA